VSSVPASARLRRYLELMTEMIEDPFAGLSDEPDPGPAGTLTDLLQGGRRDYVPLRKVFVQRPSTEAVRAAPLADLVKGRYHRALDALLLLHALQPVLPGTPLALKSWARILSTRTTCTPAAASGAFDTLVELQLATRSGPARRPTVEPLHEDASGGVWTRPGMVEEEGPGYFVLPHAYWEGGLADTLNLPGKAMLLIILAETQNPKTPAFSMAVERAHAWYGLSERTAERGYSELSKAGVLLVRRTKVVDKHHPAGRRDVYWRALKSPYGTADRARLQQKAKTAISKRAATSPDAATGTVTAARREADDPVSDCRNTSSAQSGRTET